MTSIPVHNKLKYGSNIKKLSRGCCPALYLLCQDIYQTYANYSFLFGEKTYCDKAEFDSVLNLANERTAYLASLQKPTNSRLHLTSTECQRSLGQQNPKRWKQFRANRKLLDIDPCPIKKEIVDTIHTLIESLWRLKEEDASKPFPLQYSKVSL